MIKYTKEQIREFIACPQFGDNHYGKWGALKLEQREAIYNLIKVNESADNIIKYQIKAIERLNNIINELEKELKNNYSIWMCKARENGKSVQFGIDVCKTHFYNRLQELKGDSSNDNN